MGETAYAIGALVMAAYGAYESNKASRESSIRAKEQGRRESRQLAAAQSEQAEAETQAASVAERDMARARQRARAQGGGMSSTVLGGSSEGGYQSGSYAGKTLLGM